MLHKYVRQSRVVRNALEQLLIGFQAARRRAHANHDIFIGPKMSFCLRCILAYGRAGLLDAVGLIHLFRCGFAGGSPFSLGGGCRRLFSSAFLFFHDPGLPITRSTSHRLLTR